MRRRGGEEGEEEEERGVVMEYRDLVWDVYGAVKFEASGHVV